MKTRLRFHLTSAKIKGIKNNAKRIQRKGTLHSLLAGLPTGAATRKIDVQNSLKSNLSYDPAIPLPGIYPKDQTSCSTDTCSAMVAVVLFIIAKK